MRHFAISILLGAFDEGNDLDMEARALEALEIAANSTDDDDLLHRICEGLHEALWMGSAKDDNIIRALKLVTKIGISSEVGDMKQAAFDALSHSMWPDSSVDIWVMALVDVSMEGIKKIYETDKEGMLEAMTMTCAELWTKVPQRRMHEKIMYAMNISIDLEAEDGLLKMIELVSVNVLTDVDEDDIEEDSYYARAIDWLIEDILPHHSEVVQVALMNTTAVLASSRRISFVLESMYALIFEDWPIDFTERGENRTKFAVRLILVEPLLLGRAQEGGGDRGQYRGGVPDAMGLAGDCQLAHRYAPERHAAQRPIYAHQGLGADWRPERGQRGGPHPGCHHRAVALDAQNPRAEKREGGA